MEPVPSYITTALRDTLFFGDITDQMFMCVCVVKLYRPIAWIDLNKIFTTGLGAISRPSP